MEDDGQPRRTLCVDHLLQVEAALSGKNGVLTCCTYKHQEEVDAAHKIIKQLRDLTGTILIILAVHLVPHLHASQSLDPLSNSLGASQELFGKPGKP